MNTQMIEFQKLRLDDANIKDVRIRMDSVEVDYVDWQERRHTLLFRGAISCFALSPHDRALSHGTIETEGSYLAECCQVAEEDDFSSFVVFNFVDAWDDLRILRIVAKDVVECVEPLP
jgi:hypothetical protein